MGEVYAARDSRLGRKVAVKILSAEFANNERLRIRFENEAKAISALNHPHICALYDVGPDYLVMEYCEGKTLAQRITQGALPIEQVVEYGMQIAGALEKAHRAGIIHRDLKPSNIMITKSGLKLLDFGLAKQRTDSSPDESTVQQVTEEGKILGTIQYMAPELLHGKNADARSDIFALGLVLYEMATGKPAFSGASKASLIAAILEHEPPHIESSAPLDRLIRACLAKDPDERIQNANDVKLQLRWLAGSDEQLMRNSPSRWKAATALIVLAAAAVLWALYLRRPSVTVERPTHTALALPAGTALASAMLGAIALSPDSKKVAMIIGPSEKTALAVHDLTTGETKTLAGTETASFPFWSPDSRQIAFFARGRLETINANGGVVQIVCAAPAGRGGAWSSRGVIVFTPGGNQPLFKVSEGGGTPVAITKLPRGCISHRFPFFLPDGETFLYVSFEVNSIFLYAGSIVRNLEKRIVDVGWANAAFADGRLLFMRDGIDLVAQRFDVSTLDAGGPLLPIAHSVDYYRLRHIGNFSATSRLLVYVPLVSEPRQIVSVDPKSGQAEPVGAPGQYTLVGLSRDGRKAAVAVGDTRDISILTLGGGAPARATLTNAYDSDARFSPDGSRLAYYALRGHPAIVIESLESGATETILECSPGLLRLINRLSCWTADGQTLLLTSVSSDKHGDIESLDIHTHKLTTIIHSSANEIDPVLSPDDRWLAYSSDETGSPQVFVTPFPALGRKWQISSDTGVAPQWSRDGKKLYFVSSGKLNVVDVDLGIRPKFSAPLPLPVSVGLTFFYDYFLTPEGRIITTRPAGEPAPRSAHLITNWTALLP
ncbi:MAG: eukaryotic-like serine/threonine-protein kinase [Thermoanaerobaculia bacterium]|jgi:Tol biopolymer transport system component/predicted Ser/Thr protein kinase|nr:eukaryotic-like serine/threonine-protein kinase [Thermoanaerobaculia bacterium]